ncbi:hypothetical protein SH611_03795 [Geminicoccaceae bacterium 1502E]|nr:hypothetical protein [Geminicoccaceae bacterium 1502E]
MLSCRSLLGAAALAVTLAVAAPVPQAAAGSQSLIDLIGKLKLHEQQQSIIEPGGTSPGFPSDLERYGWFASDSEDGYLLKRKDLKKTLKQAGIKLQKGFTVQVTDNGSVTSVGKKGKAYAFTADTGGHDQRILFDVYDRHGDLIAEGLRIQLDEGQVGGPKKVKGFELTEGSTTYSFDELISAFGVYDTAAPNIGWENPIVIAGIESKKGDLDYVIDYDNKTVTFIGASAKKKYNFSIWFNDTYGAENKTYWKVDVKTGKVVASPSA